MSLCTRNRQLLFSEMDGNTVEGRGGGVEFCIYNSIYYYTHLLQVGCYLQAAICIDAQTDLYLTELPLNDFNYKRIY